MKTKLLFISIAVATMFIGYEMHLRLAKNDFSDAILANVEALASGGESNNETQCPNPYDVKDHQLSFTQRKGTFTADGGGKITVFGKKIVLGEAYANANVTVTYEIGDCDKPSKGNCCPNSRNGEIRNVTTTK